MLSKKKTNKKYTKRKYRSIADLIEKENDILKYAGFTPEEAEVCFWNIIHNYIKLAYKEYFRRRKIEIIEKNEECDSFIEILNEYLKCANKKVKFRDMKVSCSPKGQIPLKADLQILLYYEENIINEDERFSIFSIKPSKHYVFFGRDGILVG